MSEKENSKIVNIQAYKEDGKLYRQWNGTKIVEETAEHVVLLLYRTKVSELSGQKWLVSEPMLWWFFKDKFFNVSVQIKKNKCYFYSNIASPFLIEDNTLKYIDYDLDIKKYPDIKVKIMDRTEYQLHKKLYGYSEKLINKIDGTLIDVLQLAETGQFPFSSDVVQKFTEQLMDENAYPKKHTLKTK